MPIVHGMHRFPDSCLAAPENETSPWARITAAAWTLTLAGALWFSPAAPAAEIDQWVDPEGVHGTLVIAGGRASDEVLDKFWELAGGYQSRIAVVISASNASDVDYGDATLEARYYYPWCIRGSAKVKLIHAPSREAALSPEFCKQLDDVTGIWFGGGWQHRLSERFLDTPFEDAVYAALQRGVIVGGTSAGAAIQSRAMIAGGREEPELKTGFDLLPGAVVDQHFLVRKRKTRLLKALTQFPGKVGIGIDEQTAIVVRGRKLEVVGSSTVTVCLPASPQRPTREIVLEVGDTHDLIALRRAALARAREAVIRPGSPEVERGSLVVVGGGGLPKEVVEKFISLAGGPAAPLVVLPTAEEPIPERVSIVDVLKQLGATNIRVLSARGRDGVESEAFQKALADAKGVWFGGGRQWRFIDAYAGTKAVDLFQDVLNRGGVIGGSSAGASIQAEYLCRGNPMGNEEIMCEGYDRGLGFLRGVAIDQHFTQRNRFQDMLSLVKTYPQFLGIGLDEATALVVRGTKAEVLGKHQVHFYDAGDAEEAPAHVALKAGQAFDLKERRITDEKPTLAVGN
jgi:cyanophycinase